MQITNSSQNQATTKVKVVFLGDHSTGKTSIISRFLHNKFDEECNATVGIDFLAKNVFLAKNIIRLQLWDTAGQERFRSLIPNYLKDAMIAILVYDVGNRTTFENLAEWFQLFKENKHPQAHIVLVGNKIDLPRVVTKEEGAKKAQFLGMKYFQTSAKTAANIETLFTEVAKLYANENLGQSNMLETVSSKLTSMGDVPHEKTDKADKSVQIKQKLPYQQSRRKRGCCHV